VAARVPPGKGLTCTTCTYSKTITRDPAGCKRKLNAGLRDARCAHLRSAAAKTLDR
jgi:hypothetical protein